ncbi:hypothetical protein BN6_28650 [Saccharothrix espanaensis DSM 44229]|uniref:Uncharacterized protein n=2 Tax=Saccharothrix espanaensis TaxID=103731 RepID=K0JZU6_SACES|nr:hypothetical protein BN6_28650 [Saccharothrix espanaensis DSM 44229]
MLEQIDDALERRWAAALLALSRDERARIIGWFPHLAATVEEARALPSAEPSPSHRL